MQYTRKFTINGKSVDDFTEGTIKDVVFKDVETGLEFKGFLDMEKHFGVAGYASTESFGTESYHRASPFQRFVHTDGVEEICERNEAYWIIDLIASYYPVVSNVLIQFKEGGKFEFVENPKGKDDFLVVNIRKLSDSTAIFTVEMEQWNSEKEDSESVAIATQYIPFTDMKDDCVYLYSESGVILHPNEH